MKDLKFLNSWENRRKRGFVLYILAWAVALPVGSLIGKSISDYIGLGTLFKPFSIYDLIAILIICVLGILLGTYFWIHNEKHYKELKNINTSDHEKI